MCNLHDQGYQDYDSVQHIKVKDTCVRIFLCRGKMTMVGVSYAGPNGGPAHRSRRLRRIRDMFYQAAILWTNADYDKTMGLKEFTAKVFG